MTRGIYPVGQGPRRTTHVHTEDLFDVLFLDPSVAFFMKGRVVEVEHSAGIRERYSVGKMISRSQSDTDWNYYDALIRSLLLFHDQSPGG